MFPVGDGENHIPGARDPYVSILPDVDKCNIDAHAFTKAVGYTSNDISYCFVRVGKTANCVFFVMIPWLGKRSSFPLAPNR